MGKNDSVLRAETDLQPGFAQPLAETAAPAEAAEAEAEAAEAENDVKMAEAESGMNTAKAAQAGSGGEAEEGFVSPVKPPEKPYHQRYYLLYGAKARETGLDLEGTRLFLQNMGFDGGELRQARQGKDYAAALQAAGSGPAAAFCSYCGSEISGVDYYRLPDGRLRCTTCSNTVVKSRGEVKAILDRVLANMDSFFGATISAPVDIETLEQRKLKKKINCPISQVDNQSILILGVAVSAKGQYRILLENGAPRISLIATFAHELTHIWQYTHWDAVKDFPKCAGSKRLLIYEGMAKWAEIQYLYLIGENAVAQREEAFTRKRQDEYGMGFRLYENYYPLTREAMACENTPFVTGKYPFE